MDRWDIGKLYWLNNCFVRSMAVYIYPYIYKWPKPTQNQWKNRLNGMGSFLVAFDFKIFSRYHIYYLYIYTHICIYVHYMLWSSESMFEVRPCYVVASACFQSVRVYLQTTTNNAQTTCYAKWTLWRISNCQLIQCQVDALCFLKLSTKKPGDLNRFQSCHPSVRA